MKNIILYKNREDDKQVIDFLNCTNFLCFIVKDYSCDFVVTNQTGGYMCNHPVINGFPIMLDINKINIDGLNHSEDYDSVEEFLEKTGLDSFFESRIFGEESSYYEEAWVNVKVKEDCDWLPLIPYRGCKGVITYCNSD